MIVIRILDIFWYVIPAFRQREFEVYWTDVAILIGHGRNLAGVLQFAI